MAGGASRSYGIQVGRLAGLPTTVVARAREILANLEGGELDSAGRPRLAEHAGTPAASPQEPQLGLFGAVDAMSEAEREALDALRDTDADRVTPLDALALLARLRERLGGGS